MAITSVGYDSDQGINEGGWATISRYLGKEPCTLGATGWQVTSVTGPDRTVRVAVGTGYGWGVKDDSSTSVDLQLATVASGSRWDTIVAARDWRPIPGGVTSFAVRQGTSTKALAASLLNNPGVQHDQPLALVQVTAGVSTPTAVIDLRKDLDGHVKNKDAAALVGGRLLDIGWSPFLYWSSLAKQSYQAEWHVVDGTFSMRGDGGPKTVNAWVGPGTKGIGTVPAGFEPPVPVRVALATLGASPADLVVVRGVVNTDGSMEIYVPNGYTVAGVAYDGISYSLEA